MRLLNWNLAWATHSSVKGNILLKRITDESPAIAVLTEVNVQFVEALGGYAAFADSEGQKKA